MSFSAHDAFLESGIIFIRYAQNRKIGEPNNLKVHFYCKLYKLFNKRDLYRIYI